MGTCVLVTSRDRLSTAIVSAAPEDRENAVTSQGVQMDVKTGALSIHTPLKTLAVRAFILG